jgi:hypothetical protein
MRAQSSAGSGLLSKRHNPAIALTIGYAPDEDACFLVHIMFRDKACPGAGKSWRYAAGNLRRARQTNLQQHSEQATKN